MLSEFMKAGDPLVEGPQESDEKVVSLVEMKDFAMKCLPKTSELREIILAEPDFVLREEAEYQVSMFSRLLRIELRNH